jgi:hypothetical protein
MGRRITLELPDHLVDRIDELKKEWCIRSRGDCLTRLLEEIWTDEAELNTNIDDLLESGSVQDPLIPSDPTIFDAIGSTPAPHPAKPSYNEDRAIVLVSRSGDSKEQDTTTLLSSESSQQRERQSKSRGIDLPGFVRGRTQAIRTSLQQPEVPEEQRDSPFVPVVSFDHLTACCAKAIDHWTNLYGSMPGATVLEAVMLWMARDIWPQLDGSEGRTFTWSQVNQSMRDVCADWSVQSPKFEHVIVAAAVLEDPFAAGSVEDRIPTLIRRFVNRFKRSRRVTSFETLESTMTLHGALRLLELPTQAGASLTLRSIRDAYKRKAIEAHPDAGGSTDGMRRLNEAYQMLRELYRDKESQSS